MRAPRLLHAGRIDACQWPDTIARDARALARVWGHLIDQEAQAREAGARNAERIARDGDRRVQMDAADAMYRRLLDEWKGRAP